MLLLWQVIEAVAAKGIWEFGELSVCMKPCAHQLDLTLGFRLVFSRSHPKSQERIDCPDFTDA